MILCNYYMSTHACAHGPTNFLHPRTRKIFTRMHGPGFAPRKSHATDSCVRVIPPLSLFNIKVQMDKNVYSGVRISQQARNFLACWVRPNFWLAELSNGQILKNHLYRQVILVAELSDSPFLKKNHLCDF